MCGGDAEIASRYTMPGIASLSAAGGERSFTDGPFAETKEQLGGFVMIEAPDMEAAKEIVLGLSVGALGPMEIRPVWKREDLVARRVTARQAAVRQGGERVGPQGAR